MFNPCVIKNLKSLQRSLLITILPIFLLFLIPGTAQAIEQTSKQWEAIVLDADLSERIRLRLDLQNRGNSGFGYTNSIYVRPILSYQVTKNLSVGPGFAWTPKFYPYRNQYRIFEQLVYKQKYKKLSIENRLRLEQRYAGPYSGASVRIRGRLKFSHPIPKHPTWYLIAYNELYYNINSKHDGPQRGIDQNRAFAGIGHRLNDNTALEAGYMMQYINEPDGVDNINHIMRVGLKFKP